jgi:serine/threonine protein kinase/Tol biopolymer transport system component
MDSNSESRPSSPSTNERWNRIDQLLQSALDHEPDQRAAFLREACAGDEPLLREVESLVSSYEQAGDFLERPTVRVALERFPLERAGFLVGRQVGPYELLSLLGAGGMGEVYRATDTRLKRFVAIKFLSADSSLDEKRLQYFEREARLASALNHPNIVTIYDIGRSEFGPYIAMELVDGKTLRDTLADGPLPLKRVLQLAAQLADGLAKAHAAGIFHRDLKPENLMITREGLVKILDFGLAKLTPTPASEDAAQATMDMLRSKPGVILGTIGYMSPEQASGLPADFRSDQFSVGSILYEMTTGKHPFRRATSVETLSAIIRDEPEPVAAVNPNVPMNIRWIIGRCLAKNVEERYASTLDLARDLQNLREHFSDVASWDASRTLATPTSKTTSWSLFFVAAGLATLVLGVAIGAVLRRDFSAPPIFHEISFGHGNITSARFAADGQTVIYGANWSGQAPELYSMQPGNPESRSFGVRNAGIWSVSSTGEMAIAYPCTDHWGGCIGPLALVPPAGGVPSEVLDSVTAADWAPDGKTLAVAQFVRTEAGEKTQIIQYSPANGVEKVLYDTAGWVGGVRVSPHGDRIAFTDHPILGDVSGSISVLDSTGTKKVLSSGWWKLMGLAWSPQGDEVWFSGARETTSGTGLNIFAVTLSGTERLLHSTPGVVQIMDISRDGGRALVVRKTGRAVLMGLAPGDPKERDLSWFDFSFAADLSSDGKTLLFYEWGGAVGGIETTYLRKSDGSGAKRLGEGKPLALSPDGQFALVLRHSIPPQLVLLPTGLGKEIPLPRGVIGEFWHWAAWSPDGEQIFFTAAEPGHRRRTWVQDRYGGLPQPVTPEGMEGTLLAPDGQLIAAVDRYHRYYLCPVDGRPPKALEGYEDGDVLLQWSGDGRAIFLRGPGDAELKIYRLDLKTGTRQLWKKPTPPYAAGLFVIGTDDPGQVRITPDGQSYVYTFFTGSNELYLAEGLK